MPGMDDLGHATATGEHPGSTKTRELGFTYALFGGVIHSSIPLPELRPVDSDVWDWHFEVVDELEPAREVRTMGSMQMYAEIYSRTYAHAAGYRVEVDDTGVFDVSADGRFIRHRPRADPWWDFGRAHLLGQVMAISLQIRSVITLHASAVETRDGVIGFLAPKHFGKTTLSLILTREGARFVTDDTLPVQLGDPPLALPGVQSLRVLADNEEAKELIRGAFGAPVRLESANRDGKIRTPPLPLPRILSRARKLEALYLLQPVRAGDGGESVERLPTHGPEAVANVLGQTKIGGVLGPGFVPDLLRQVSGIARQVPVYRLRIVRDLERLPEVAERLLSWHGTPGEVT